jgi:hypothetical protein
MPVTAAPVALAAADKHIIQLLVHPGEAVMVLIVELVGYKVIGAVLHILVKMVVTPATVPVVAPADTAILEVPPTTADGVGLKEQVQAQMGSHATLLTKVLLADIVALAPADTLYTITAAAFAMSMLAEAVAE